MFQIERLVEVSSNLAIKEWRRLPSIVSHIHIPLLQVRWSSLAPCCNGSYLRELVQSCWCMVLWSECSLWTSVSDLNTEVSVKVTSIH